MQANSIQAPGAAPLAPYFQAKEHAPRATWLIWSVLGGMLLLFAWAYLFELDEVSTGTGKVMYAQAGKRHGMIKRTTKQIRNLRGTTTLFEGDAANVKKYFLPNAR